MNIQETWMLLQIARESMPFPQLRPIHAEALKQLAAISASVAPAPAQVKPASAAVRPALPARGVV